MTPEQLKRIRGRMKMTQVQLAAALGVRQESVGRWEIGSRRIPEPTARLIEFIGKMAARIEAGRLERTETQLFLQLVRRADARGARGGRGKKRHA